MCRDFAGVKTKCHLCGLQSVQASFYALTMADLSTDCKNNTNKTSTAQPLESPDSRKETQIFPSISMYDHYVLTALRPLVATDSAVKKIQPGVAS